jgi:hypothetical protein
MLKWSYISKTKNKGGLGIKDLEKMNISLILKWWWKLENKDCLWQKIVKAKYLKGKPVSLVEIKQGNSPYWVDLMKIGHLYLDNRKIKVGNGEAGMMLGAHHNR